MLANFPSPQCWMHYSIVCFMNSSYMKSAFGFWFGFWLIPVLSTKIFFFLSVFPQVDVHCCLVSIPIVSFVQSTLLFFKSLASLREGDRKISFFQGFVRNYGQVGVKSHTLLVQIVFWVILGIIFSLKVLKMRGWWIGSAVQDKVQKNTFFSVPFPYGNCISLVPILFFTKPLALVLQFRIIRSNSNSPNMVDARCQVLNQLNSIQNSHRKLQLLGGTVPPEEINQFSPYSGNFTFTFS